MRNGSPQANKTVQWTVLSDERLERKRKAGELVKSDAGRIGALECGAPSASEGRGIPAWGLRREREDGGAGGIRTLDTAFQPYNGLANRRLQPLGHSTIPNFSRRGGPKRALLP